VAPATRDGLRALFPEHGVAPTIEPAR
jgi:hypothetical protein